MASLADELARTAVRDLDPYSWEVSTHEVARRHCLDIDDVIRFDLNASPFLPAGWDEAIEVARRESRPNEYFDTRYEELTALFAEHCGVPGDHIVVGAGADEVLDIIARVFIERADAVVTPVPTYPMYRIISDQRGAELRQVPLRGHLSPDIDAIIAAARGAKLLWYCNPNNPTGAATHPGDLERLVSEASCMVVVDEAYAEYMGWSAVPLVGRHENLIVVRTMSKAFAMAGLRLGWGVAQPAVIELLHRVRPPNSVSCVTCAVGAAAMRDVATMRANVTAVVRERERLALALGDLGACVHASLANFLLTDWRSPSNAEQIARWLEGRGRVVRSFPRHPRLASCAQRNCLCEVGFEGGNRPEDASLRFGLPGPRD